MLTFDEAVKELYFSIYGSNPTNFHAILYHLISKADPENLERLWTIYPAEVRAWRAWQASNDEVAFFSQFGFTPGIHSIRKGR